MPRHSIRWYRGAVVAPSRRRSADPSATALGTDARGTLAETVDPFVPTAYRYRVR